ncbi:MAG: hypothetical protein TRG1_2959 [Flavobacteriaceae bacterium FS1-H7996/R]|nr:MAG: hypothetical protein TRG1_2959 [Flavobacteriaceae bacterium FS1-H7996/R]
MEWHLYIMPTVALYFEVERKKGCFIAVISKIKWSNLF